VVRSSGERGLFDCGLFQFADHIEHCYNDDYHNNYNHFCSFQGSDFTSKPPAYDFNANACADISADSTSYHVSAHTKTNSCRDSYSY
jgi:hypothetical protein